MSIEVLQTEVTALSSEQRRKLMAFMVVLEDRSRADYAEELTRKIDDKSPGPLADARRMRTQAGT
ncbi:MAG: hypothetical protein WDM80_16370 [Limisphaerales bacterium]